jgi:tol-pal system protein YbgF
MKPTFKAASAAIMAALFLGAPMSAHAILEDAEARRAILELRKQISDLTARIDAKIAPMAARIDSKAETKSMIDLAGEIERLRTDVAGLRGQLEILSNDIANAQKRQKDFYVDLDQRLRNVEQKQVALETKAAEQKPGDLKAAEQRAAAEQKANEQKALDAGQALFKSGDYSGAAESLSTFVQRYPESSLMSTALFWLGSSYFAMLDCPRAIQALQQMNQRYPNYVRVPDAMLSIASCQLDMNDKNAAMATLNSLVKKFPNSPAAAAARERQQELK